MQQTDKFIDHCADYFDNAVASASDDELFAQGYLRGHIDLAVGRLQVQDEPFSVEDITQTVAESLQSAIAAGELNAADAALVQRIWLLLAAADKTTAAE